MRSASQFDLSSNRSYEFGPDEHGEDSMTTGFPIPEGKYAVTDADLKLHYHEAGNGEPVVFLHGSGPGASGYSNFKGNYPVFAQAGYRAIVPDLPGFGLSSKPDTNYVLDFFVEAVHGFIGKLGLERCTLLGNSLGGAIALKYTLDHPEVVTRLILMAPGGIEELPVYLQMEGIRKMIEVLSAGPMDTESMRRLLTLQLYDPSHITAELLAERVGVCAMQPRRVLSTMRVPNMAERLAEIRCPVLGFWGTNDRFNPATGAMKIVERCAQARLLLLNRCGHWVMVEHRDLFNRSCLDFLRNG
jgi:4,5:9,10-diseco-3-hydroxy-5,9,17-trioxoandrosta-1(10),2-diene-4-oate hydrolase